MTLVRERVTESGWRCRDVGMHSGVAPDEAGGCSAWLSGWWVISLRRLGGVFEEWVDE